MAKFIRTTPPRPPAGPPTSVKEGAAAVRKATMKLFDRQDGEGVNKRLMAEIPFKATFETLDRIVDDDQKKSLATRVHVRPYLRIQIWPSLFLRPIQ
jgi:hypothetical protein